MKQKKGFLIYRIKTFETTPDKNKYKKKEETVKDTLDMQIQKA